MKPFMDSDFLLNTQTAKDLFFQVAKDLPIYDYHCHLDPKEIYEDRSYETITQLWLNGDHYKWRQMRLCGIDESLITGSGSDREKFRAYASIMPKLIGNPLYHWSHLELQRYFNLYEPLSLDTADAIYDNISQQLKDGSFTARRFISMSNVAVVCTTDDPSSDLKYHRLLKEEGFTVRVLPTFRPDKALQIGAQDFPRYILGLQLNQVSLDALIDWLYARADSFAQAGCVISDHAFTSVPYAPCDKALASEIFARRLSGSTISEAEAEAYMAYLFHALNKKYKELDWAVQIHIGALRNNNWPMFKKLGPDTGYDSINDEPMAKKLSHLLGDCVNDDTLPKTILYTLKPSDNYVLATMLGNFAGQTEGKLQFGSAWWFYDHFEGMTRHLKDLAALGSLGTFIGMLTDSRSLLSYPRHEYFRRILCRVIGEWVEDGQYPNDKKALSSLVRGICCDNVRQYLGL